MTDDYHVAILGLGAMGSAAAAHLARRGVRVIGFDRFSIPNTMGSSHGRTRVIRLCYYEHPDYVPLLRRAFALWRELDASFPEPILYMTGGLYIGPTTGEFITGSLRAASMHDLPHEVLDAGALARRFPQFSLKPGQTAVYEPNAGFVMSERTIAAQVAIAIEHGATLLSDARVIGVERADHGVIVRTSGGTFRATRLIVTAGAFTAPLFEDLNLPLRTTRQTLGWITPQRRDPFELGTLPVWGIDDPSGHFHYGFPILPGEASVKVARHYIGPPCDPETIEREVTPGEARDLCDLMNETIPDAAGPLESAAVCMYTNTPDGHFIIDAHPDDDRIIIAAGFSGHGFKFAPVVGEILADLAIRGATDHPIDFLRLNRFGL